MAKKAAFAGRRIADRDGNMTPEFARFLDSLVLEFDPDNPSSVAAQIAALDARIAALEP